MAETRCKYYKQKKQVSYDGGQTWQDVIPYQYQRGELYEYESSDCGALVVYRWVNMDASVDYYCEGTTKYYKQKKQVSYDGGTTWQDVSPAEYQKGGVAEQRSTDCGYVPPTPQYRWIKSDDTICVEILYRWVNMDASTDYYCEGTTKYYKQKQQVSNDGGQTWQDVTPPVYQKGGVAETESTDCGYVPPQYRWVNMDASVDYYCEGTTKYYKQKKQVSYDGGQTWQDVSPAEYQKGGVAETQSTDCGYVPPTPPSPYESQYFTIVPRENGLVRFRISTANTSYYYSTNSGATWVTGNSATTIAATSGNKIMFKGNLTPVQTPTGGAPPFGVGDFSGTSVTFDAEGNIMSLLYGDDFRGKYNLTGKDFAFNAMFQFNTNIISAENLILPAITLADYCYENMFQFCTYLTKAPALPATTLARECYIFMFRDCTSLIEAPALPATTLAEVCYEYMFANCTFTTPPELPATTLADYCYVHMFSGCTFTTPPELPATTLATNCYDGMFRDCASLTSVPELPATTLAPYCYDGMFIGCVGLTTIPNNLLPATTLAEGCYNGMFMECTGIAEVPSDLLPATTLTVNCYHWMFDGCTSLTRAPELPATTLVEWCYNEMFRGCTSLYYIKCLAMDISAKDYCTANWVGNVNSRGTFVTPSSTNWPWGTSGIPTGWTRVDA